MRRAAPLLAPSLYLYGGVAVDYVNSEYGTGGEIHIEEGSEAQPVIIGNIYLTYEDEVGLDSLWIHGGGYLRLIGDTAAVKDLTIQSGGVLEFENPQMDDVTFNSLTGGGTLVLPSGACLAVTGSVTGDTSLRILPGTESGDGYVDGIALGTYVTAAPDSTAVSYWKTRLRPPCRKRRRQVGPTGRWFRSMLLYSTAKGNRCENAVRCPWRESYTSGGSYLERPRL